jgi:hypothetical protein
MHLCTFANWRSTYELQSSTRPRWVIVAVAVAVAVAARLMLSLSLSHHIHCRKHTKRYTTGSTSIRCVYGFDCWFKTPIIPRSACYCIHWSKSWWASFDWSQRLAISHCVSKYESCVATTCSKYATLADLKLIDGHHHTGCTNDIGYHRSKWSLCATLERSLASSSACRYDPKSPTFSVEAIGFPSVAQSTESISTNTSILRMYTHHTTHTERESEREKERARERERKRARGIDTIWWLMSLVTTSRMDCWTRFAICW